MTHPSRPDPQEEPIAEPPQIRFLRRLVTALTAIMVGGLLVVITLLVIRLSGGETAVSARLPETITLPAGQSPTAVTFGAGWIAVVTDAQQILIFDAETGALRQEVAITSSAP